MWFGENLWSFEWIGANVSELVDSSELEQIWLHVSELGVNGQINGFYELYSKWILL